MIKALEGLGSVASAQGLTRQSAGLLSAAEALRSRIRYCLEPGLRSEIDRTLAALRERLDPQPCQGVGRGQRHDAGTGNSVCARRNELMQIFADIVSEESRWRYFAWRMAEAAKQAYDRTLGRYCKASAICAAWMFSHPARSAIVRASFSTR